jgi:alkylhydroperoxidase family enzyme
MAAPRIPLLEKEEAVRRAAECGVPAPLAELNVFRVLLNHPKLAGHVSGLLTGLLFGAKLDVRLRELVILRLGWRSASDYEWTQHWRVALQLGLPEADCLAVREWRDSDCFGAADRAVLAATDETLDTGAISPATWALCEEHVGEAEELLELVIAIGNWRMFSSLLRSLEIPLEDGVDSWPPDGRRP